MKKNISIYWIWAWAFFIISTSIPVKAQINSNVPDRTIKLKKQLSLYLAEHPSSNLYLHLDKNIYLPEETIWFKAYLLGDTSTANKVLYLRIANENKEVVLSAQFPMYDIRAHGSISLYTKGKDEWYNGETHGDINLYMPKVLGEGKYNLYAYTDRMLSYGDTNIFVQPIQIRKQAGKRLETEASITNRAQLRKGGEVQVTAKLRENGIPAKNIRGEYELLVGENSIKYGRLTTNQLGEAFINFIYPELEKGEYIKVKILFNSDNDFTELSLNLPREDSPLEISIRPEGGQLLADVTGKVSIEVLDIMQNPISTELLLKKADQLITKVVTNKLGIATLTLKPEMGSRYTVETTGAKKQVVAFPETALRPVGYSLKLRKTSNDLTATVYNKDQQGDALLVLRAANEILWTRNISVAPSDSLDVQIPVGNFPKNILSLSVFDNENRPQAERLFLNKEEEDYRMSIVTDRTNYGLQQKITVTISISDAKGKPVVANLSISAVEKVRMDSAVCRNIFQSWYYRPFKQSSLNRFFSTRNGTEMDDLLMASHWNGNEWNEINTYLSKGQPLRLKHADGAIGQVVFKGNAFFNYGSEVRKTRKIYIQSVRNNGSLSSVVHGETSFTNRVPVNLDSAYQFYLPASALLSRKGEEWMLDIYEPNNYFKSNFFVEWKDDNLRFDSTVVKKGLLEESYAINSFAISKEQLPSAFSFKGTNQLAEVAIGRKQETVRKKLRKECSDRCCTYGTFDCVMHPNNQLKKGEIYAFGYSAGGMQRIATYLGCTNFKYIHEIKNITIPEEFPLPDYDLIPRLNEDLRSTIYWNPNIVTDANGTATFSFFTSDVLGEFEITAQGLDVNTLRPLMGKGKFIVKVSE